MTFDTQGNARAHAAEQRLLKVLVVDDDAELCGNLTRALARAHYNALPVSGGREALVYLEEALKGDPFDAMITDIHLPGLRGDELQRLARQLDPDTAILLLSDLQDVSLAVEYLKEGVQDYITKPLDISDVVVRVGKAIRNRDLRIAERAEREALERRVEEQDSRIREMLQQSLDTLCNALDARGADAQHQSRRSSALATALARRLRPEDTDFARMVQVAAALRDLGKIGVPDAVLNKPGRLLESEFALIRTHPETSEAIVGPMFSDPVLLSCIRHHHEHWNGNGYPDGLVGEAIPLGARIVGVADAFDAMISPRPYRAGQMSPDDAIATIQTLAGTQMDAEVVEALLSLHQEGALRSLLPTAVNTGDTGRQRQYSSLRPATSSISPTL